MTFQWPWMRAKPNGRSVATAPEARTAERPLAPAATAAGPPPARVESQLKIRKQSMPRPALRWVGGGRIALRAFVFENDADAICGFQEETYKLNFPNFRYTASFADAFRYDLRRASVDPNHGIFVLDDGRETPGQKSGNIAGFLWVVVAQNNWSGDRYGYVNNLYVAPERRGCGLGLELMKQSDEFFRSRGIKSVRLTVTVDNAAAVKLYKAAGYKVDRWEMQKDL